MQKWSQLLAGRMLLLIAMVAGWQTAVSGAAHLPNAAAHIGTVVINRNDQFTTNVSVTLTLNAVDSGTGVAKMQFSNDNETWSVAEKYRTNKVWLLVDDGSYPAKMNTVLKTVYTRFQDGAGNWSKAVSDSIVFARSSADVPRIREVWIAQHRPVDYDSGAAAGAKRNPYLIPVTTNEVAFDTLMNSLMTNYSAYQPQARWTTNATKTATNDTTLTIYIGAGVYETHGDCTAHGQALSWAPGNGWRIFGAGKDVTTLKAVDLRGGWAYRVNVIGGNGANGNLEIADLTLDANIHEGGTNMNGQYAQGIYFKGSNVQIRRVKVKNCGSHMTGAEPAAINMQTFGSQFGESNLILEDCDVGYPQYGNAYRPDAIVVSGVYGTDQTMRYYSNVVVRNCYVDGAAYDGNTAINPALLPATERAAQGVGVGGTWGAVVEDNLILNTVSGYYLDSASMHDLTIRNNHFRNVLYGVVVGLGTTTQQTRRIEDAFRLENNLVELDPHFYTKGDTYGTYGWRYCLNFTGDLKGPDDYIFNKLIITNNTFQFTDQRSPDTNVAGITAVFTGFRTTELVNNTFRGMSRPVTWDNGPACLLQQVDIAYPGRPAPLASHHNTRADGTIVESYPYVLDSSLPRPVVVEGEVISFPAPTLDGLPATVADGVPVTNALAGDGWFRWRTTAQDAGVYVVSFYDRTNRLHDPRRTLITVLDRVAPADPHYFANGLMAYWKFDETAGVNFGDTSGNGVNLTAAAPINAAFLTLGVDGYAPGKKAAHFNSRPTNVAELFASPSFSARLFGGFPVFYHPLLDKATILYHALSFSFWFKADTEPRRNQMIIHPNGPSGAFACEVMPGSITNDQKIGLRFATYDGSVKLTSPAGFPVSAWHQVVVVYDGVSVRMYVDATLAAEQALGQLPGFSSASALSFGGGWGGDGYVGGLCDVALWNRALSGTEIAQLYSQQMAGVNLAAAPIAPSALIAQVISGTTVQITWLDNSSNESGFVLQRSVDGTNFTTSATLPSNATAWVDTLPEPTGAYAYRVKAANSLGDSEYSGVAWVGQPSPTAPTRLRVLGVTAQ